MKSFKELKEKLNNQMLFFVMAIVMVLITLSLSIYLLMFLVSNLGQVFTINASPVPTQRFDIQGFEKLNLIK